MRSLATIATSPSKEKALEILNPSLCRYIFTYYPDLTVSRARLSILLKHLSQFNLAAQNKRTFSCQQSSNDVTHNALIVAAIVSKLLFVCHIATANEIPTKVLYKLDHNSERLPDSTTKWQCVEDASTGLFWQKRDPTTALHGRDTYVWHQPKHQNPGSPRANPNLLGLDATCYGYNTDDPSSFCNTHAYANRVNQSNYCGFSDWRLPTSNELISLSDPSLVDRPFQSPVDLRYFPFYDNFVYWTDSVNKDGIVVTLIKGIKLLNNSERSDSILVRLVRGTIRTGIHPK